jgi:hypothetical protein
MVFVGIRMLFLKVVLFSDCEKIRRKESIF